ncbi:metal-dependent amidase/aminoacylase/carboxypeptidase [Saccharata proteae CBS 121410]|uniref:Metal-dependent amidase/aminoacylase/carboxypeptidase n=1 Tax=Saccharata proteae CBS 121410 TaxID=1314787 RepID=A0A9P4I0A0_9PEZI|nr:metal-dependent amidase/aminoacylase/carboxypeptidase [Saccharata proteae CBS 121410]
MSKISQLIQAYRPDLAAYEALYKHLHQNPELSFQEKDTAAEIKQRLEKLPEYKVHTDIGGHGLAAVLENGAGKTILLRADIDGLPVEEKTGLPYASKKKMINTEGVEKPTMHACGHDMHITSLLAAAELLVKAKEEWSGTLLLVFQPAEEMGKGAQAMVDDGLYKKVPIPDIAVGGHVMPYRSGVIGTRRGLMASSADSYNLTLYGRSGHASQPHVTIDPVVMAANTIQRLQTIVSREVDPLDSACVSVAYVRAGDAVNIIPERADLGLDVRAYKPATRARVLDSVTRIVNAESAASGSPRAPRLTETRSFPFLVNDDAATAAIEDSFEAHFGAGPRAYTADMPRLGGSEDCGILATAVDRPIVFFTYGGVDPEVWDKAEEEEKLGERIPINHSAYFAPVIRPTLRVAVDGYAAAALTWLVKK